MSFMIEITEIRIPSSSDEENASQLIGYGRDFDEALAHSGGEADSEEILENLVVIYDFTESHDLDSHRIADSICRFHIQDDQQTPLFVREKLELLFNKKLFATACLYCFEAIWDAGYEWELPEHERNNLPSDDEDPEGKASWLAFTNSINDTLQNE